MYIRPNMHGLVSPQTHAYAHMHACAHTHTRTNPRIEVITVFSLAFHQ